MIACAALDSKDKAQVLMVSPKMCAEATHPDAAGITPGQVCELIMGNKSIQRIMREAASLPVRGCDLSELRAEMKKAVAIVLHGTE